MRAHIDEIHSSGAELVIVGNGQPMFANSFKKKFDITSPLFVDPQMEAYKAAGLHRTKLGTIGPLVWFAALRAFLSGYRQGPTEGDPYQQGGVFIVLPGNKLVYSHISKRASDRPSVDSVLEALRRATTNVSGSEEKR